MNPALPFVFVVAIRLDYEGIVELKSAYPTEAEAEAYAKEENATLGKRYTAEVIKVPMVLTTCDECGKPFATKADVDAAYTSHMDGSGICWHGKGSAYGTDGCRNTKA